MKTEIKIEIKPFTLPGYVDEARAAALTSPAPSPAPREVDPADYQPTCRTFALRELSANDLYKLCDDFTNAVFKVAGKSRPPREERS